MKPVKFDYYAPTSVLESLDTLAELGYDGKVLAGGQSLIAAMNFRMARPVALVDLNGVPELSYIKPTAEGGLAIGTMTRVSDVEHNPEVAKKFPLLPEVAKFICAALSAGTWKRKARVGHDMAFNFNAAHRPVEGEWSPRVL